MPADPASAAAEFAAAMPFAATAGISLLEASPQRARGSVAWAEDRCTAGAVLHGGVLLSLADTVGAMCAFRNLPEGALTATVESATHFFRPIRAGTVYAVARPLHVGRSFIVVQTELTDDSGRHVGQTTQTQAVLDPERGA